MKLSRWVWAAGFVGLIALVGIFFVLANRTSAQPRFALTDLAKSHPIEVIENPYRTLFVHRVSGNWKEVGMRVAKEVKVLHPDWVVRAPVAKDESYRIQDPIHAKVLFREDVMVFRDSRAYDGALICIGTPYRTPSKFEIWWFELKQGLSRRVGYR